MKADIEFEPYVDAIWLGQNMPSSLLPVSRIDMHLFSYLACIVSLLNGNAINSWRYRYTINDEGFPFSANFDEALSAAIRGGFFKDSLTGKLNFNQRKLSSELEILKSIHRPSAKRFDHLSNSLRAALMLPIGQIRNSVSQSVSTKEVYRKLDQRRFSFQDQDEIDSIYNEYRVVYEAFDEDPGELSPLIVWISSRLISINKEFN